MELIVKLCAGSSKTALLFLLIGSLVAFPLGNAHAGVVVNQTNSTYEVGNNVNVSSFITNASGTITAISFPYNDKGQSTGHFVGVGLVDQTSGISYYLHKTGDVCGSTFESTGKNAKETKSFGFGYKFVAYPCTATSTELSLNPSRAYAFQLFRNSGGANTQVFYGSVNGDSNSVSASIYTDGSVAPFSAQPIFSTQYNTRFTTLNLLSASTTVKFNVGYFIDPEEADVNQQDKNPNQVYVRYSKVPTTAMSARSFSITDSVNPTWGNGTSTVELSLDPSSTYDVNVSFGNAGTVINGVQPFPLSYLYFNVTTDAFGGVATTTTLEIYNALEQKTFDYQPCSLTQIGGCLINAGYALVVPSDASINRFSDLYDTLSTKFPFAYLTDFRDSITSIYEGSTTASLGLTVPFGDAGDITLISADLVSDVPFTSTIRSILGALIWVMLAAQIWRRGQTIFNVKTT